MRNTSKTLALTLIITITLSCLTLLTIKPATAQSTPFTTPSIPEFTVSIVDNSHYIDPIITTTTDPYTGKPTQTTTPGSYVQEKFIEVKIKNQIFTPNLNGDNIWLNIRYKGHYTAEWTIFDPTPYQNRSDPYTYVSTYFNRVPASGDIDFQIQAINGHQTHKDNLFPQTWIVVGIESGWSDIQTIHLEDGTVTITPYTNPAPTPTPTTTQTQDPATPTPSVPEMPALMILPLLSMLSVAVLLGRRKTPNTN
jgi:hypothetical protein